MSDNTALTLLCLILIGAIFISKGVKDSKRMEVMEKKNHVLDSTIQSYRQDKFAWKVHQDQEARTQVMTIYKCMNDSSIEVIFKRSK